MNDDDKRTAALAAVVEVEEGMLVGLGTGSTAAFAVIALGERVARGLSIRAVATSVATERLAMAQGIPVIDFADISAVDLTIDGADEIDGDCRAIKGAGGAMLREKVVAAASTRMVVIADGSKRVERLGAAPVPVEVLPFARAFVLAALTRLGADVRIRMQGGALYLTDGGNLVADCRFSAIEDADELGLRLSTTPGVVGHGLFLHEVDGAYVSAGGVVTRLERNAGKR